MIKLAGFFWLVLVSTAGFAMFAVKYEVQSLEDDLNRVRKETAAEEHAIHMNEVEWAYLTRPETLEDMSRRHLTLTPIVTTQLRATLPDIPLRPPPPPPAEETVAAPSDATPLPDTAQQTAPPVAASAQALLVAAPPQTTAQASPIVAAPPQTTFATGAAPQQIPTRAADIAKPVVVKVAAKPGGARRPKTLDDLIAQIVASR
jgi:hypothetical protein